MGSARSTSSMEHPGKGKEPCSMQTTARTRAPSRTMSSRAGARTDSRAAVSQWHADRKHGKGVLIYVGGRRYDGEWEQGEKHGFGVLIEKNRDIFEGNFKRGKKHGSGVHARPNSNHCSC